VLRDCYNFASLTPECYNEKLVLPMVSPYATRKLRRFGSELKIHRIVQIVLVGLFIYPMTAGASPARIFIREYQVKGAHQLTRLEIEEAVYPYLGPGRTKEDVEKARSALEKEYQAKGYQTVSVQIPAQRWKDGSIILQVTESPVGRLRVHGARYFLPSRVKEMAPSLAEGRVVNFNDVNRDIIALNQLADERVTPSLRAGVIPGTVDIDLEVKDTFPLHGSLELNNRYSPNTTQLRLDGAVNYDNLWQLGHSIGGSFQVSPENINQVQVYSGYYLARFPEMNWFSLTLQGTKQNSQVSTLGDLAVAGAGDVVGLRAIMVLPGSKQFSDTLSLGFDYKDNNQNVAPSGSTNTTQSGYYYFPLSATYSGVWLTKTDQAEFNIGPTLSFRGLGSSAQTLEKSRFGADGNFIYLRADLSETHELPGGFQAYGKIQGQVANEPLVSAEQFGGGGLGTVRGYLEGEVFGDDAMFGSFELRSPSLLHVTGDKNSDWRFYFFAEAGRLLLLQPLPQQTSEFDLASFGIGSRIGVADHFNGSLDLGIPVISQSQTSIFSLGLTFRVWVVY
jgi:hemolysin activation/secretion protein